MGTFAAGYFLDSRTGRPLAAQVVRVVDFQTEAPLTPEGGAVATGARGGYGRFVVPGVDAVTLVASDGSRVDLVSLEQQLAAAPELPATAAAGEVLTWDGSAWVADIPTSGSGLVPDPDYPGYYVISEGGGGDPLDYPPTITLGVSTDGLDATATFTAADPEGDPVTVSVSWGDGQTTDPATSPATHTYATGGTYTVTATATANGKTGTDSTTVTVAQVNAPGAYSAAVLADSPYVYMPFTEESAPFLDATGTVTPSSVGTHEATPGGQALGTLPRSAGFSITSGQQATYSIGALPGSPPAASVEFVARPWSLSGSFAKIIHGATVEVSNTGYIRIWNGSGWVATPTGVLATGGVITHVVAVWTATDVKIYINGVEQASSASTYSPGSVTEWAVGGPVPAGSLYYRGYLAGVAFYDRALTQAEAADHFAALGIGA